MLDWLKNNYGVLLSGLVTILMGFYLWSCEPKVKSIEDNKTLVTRAELQLELDRVLKTATYRMSSLDRQEAVRSLILQNVLLLGEGQPLNPVGLITAFAALYGVSQAGSKVKTAVKNGIAKRKATNGTENKTIV